jgi:hypothetical protein
VLSCCFVLCAVEAAARPWQVARLARLEILRKRAAATVVFFRLHSLRAADKTGCICVRRNANFVHLTLMPEDCRRKPKRGADMGLFCLCAAYKPGCSCMRGDAILFRCNCWTLVPEDCEGCGVFFCMSSLYSVVQGPCLRRYALQAHLREMTLMSEDCER